MPDPSQLKIFLMTESAIPPRRGSGQAVGYDLSADVGFNPIITVWPGQRAVISTGVAAAIPEGYYGRVAPRSGLAAKNGIVVLGGVVDPDYRGEIKVMLLNTGSNPLRIDHGDRIAQLILERVATPEIVLVYHLEDLGETKRGDAGFGSTGGFGR